MDFRTDLAVERRDVFRKINKISQEIPGIESEEKQISDTIHVYNVRVKDDEGAKAIQKPTKIIQRPAFVQMSELCPEPKNPLVEPFLECLSV